VNPATIPARQLICLLQDTASGIPADLAAVGLLARHNHFLHQPAFRRVIAVGASVLTGEPVLTIRWQAAITALEAGRLPATGSEQSMLRIAASLGDHDIRPPPRGPRRPRPPQHHPRHRRHHPGQRLTRRNPQTQGPPATTRQAAPHHAPR
jgi:hypothetical protein